MGRLRDKVILITGAAGGIGSAVAEAVVRNGGIAVATDLAGRAGIDHALDVTSEADWQRVIGRGRRERRPARRPRQCGRHRGVGTVEDTDFATWRRVMAINLDGTFLGCKYAMPLLKQGRRLDREHLVGVGARRRAQSRRLQRIEGRRAAAHQIGRAARRARNKPPVRCNSVHPTFIEGPMTDALLSIGAEAGGDAREHGALDPAAAASASRARSPTCASICCRTKSAFVTGAEFAIDGGLTAQ